VFEPLGVPKKLFGMLKTGHNGTKQPFKLHRISFKMVISKFQNSFSALQAILRYPNSFLGTINDSGILHYTQTIKIINHSVIECKKNGAKMNKIVQK